ncbi:AcrR family transcriptional regulator [Amorphus suaedae]
MGETQDSTGRRRLPREERRRQLLDTALSIVRDEGADRLTLGHLAARASVSKPVAYDHFGTRSGLLIELYKMLDLEQSRAVYAALALGERSLEDVVEALAAAYIHCSVDTGGEFHVVRAALAGNEEMDAVHQELLAVQVQFFAATFRPHCALPPAELERRCVGLVGAGEALSTAMVRGQCSETEASGTFAAIMRGSLAQASS